MPLVKPGLLATGVLIFQANRNNFEGALACLNTLKKCLMVLRLPLFGAPLSREAPKWLLAKAVSTAMANRHDLLDFAVNG